MGGEHLQILGEDYQGRLGGPHTLDVGKYVLQLSQKVTDRQ